MKVSYFAFLGIIFSLFSCENGIKKNGNSTTKNAEKLEVQRIVFGSSFGMCRGYCKKWVTFTQNETAYTELAHDSIQFPTKRLSEKSAVFESLVQQMNWKSWDTLSANIGCPDCTDAGAEYIEILSNKGTKRVRFDAGTNPEVLGNIVPRMRFIHEKMNKKMNNPEE